MDVNRLLSDELQYELLYRGVTTVSGAEEMRKALRRLLKLEIDKQCPKVSISPSKIPDPASELAVVERKLAELDILIDDFTDLKNSNSYRKIYTRLLHVLGRVQRISTDDEEQNCLKSSLLTEVLDAIGKLEAKEKANARALNVDSSPREEKQGQDVTVPPPALPVDGEGLGSPQGTDYVAESLGVAQPQVVIRKNQIPIKDWGLKFYGNEYGLSVNAFLDEIKSLRIARNVSYDDLIRSAVDLFEGPALIWYRANRHLLRDWSLFVRLLREEFEPFDYSERLWEEIKSRTQGRDEKFGHYISIMKNYFSRLPDIPSEDMKLRILLRNIQPFYLEHLCLRDIHSIDELLSYGRKLEYIKVRNEQFRQPPPRKGLLEPDLAYNPPQRNNAPRVAAAAAEEDPLKSFPVEPAPQRNHIQPRRLVCWNCKVQGHSFRQCKEKLGVFCHICGLGGTITKDCNHRNPTPGNVRAGRT